MKYLKNLSAALAAVLMVASTTVSTSAYEADLTIAAEKVAPAYEIASNPVSQLSISGATASCLSKVSGPSVKSITAEQTLEKFWGLWVWNEVVGANWSKSVNYNNITMSNKKYDLDSGTYRLKTVFTLTSTSGSTETITVYSQEKTI